jgi:hypothetical protein
MTRRQLRPLTVLSDASKCNKGDHALKFIVSR